MRSEDLPAAGIAELLSAVDELARVSELDSSIVARDLAAVVRRRARFEAMRLRLIRGSGRHPADEGRRLDNNPGACQDPRAYATIFYVAAGACHREAVLRKACAIVPVRPAPRLLMPA